MVGGLKECAKCCEGREESKLLIGGQGFSHVLVLSLPVAYTNSCTLQLNTLFNNPRSVPTQIEFSLNVANNFIFISKFKKMP